MCTEALRARVNEIFEGRATVDDLLDVFTFEHNFNRKVFTAEARLSLGAENDVELRGKFLCRNAAPAEAGTFYRRFYRNNDILFAHHADIRVTPAYQDHKLATTHYTRALRFYASIGLQCVYMEANQDGPTVWPGFAFELRDPTERDDYEAILRRRLAKYVNAAQIETLMAQAGSFTPLLAGIAVTPREGGDEVPVGLLALRELYERRPAGAELRMVAWLDQPKVRDFLVDGDIISGGKEGYSDVKEFSHRTDDSGGKAPSEPTGA